MLIVILVKLDEKRSGGEKRQVNYRKVYLLLKDQESRRPMYSTKLPLNLFGDAGINTHQEHTCWVSAMRSTRTDEEHHRRQLHCFCSTKHCTTEGKTVVVSGMRLEITRWRTSSQPNALFLFHETLHNRGKTVVVSGMRLEITRFVKRTIMYHKTCQPH